MPIKVGTGPVPYRVKAIFTEKSDNKRRWEGFMLSLITNTLCILLFTYIDSDIAKTGRAGASISRKGTSQAICIHLQRDRRVMF